MIGPSDPVRLSSGESSDFGPAWSPDDHWIAFLRAKDPFSCAVMLISSLGGPARELARLRVDMLRFIHYGYWTVTPPFLAWSSDNKWLLALEQSGAETWPPGAPVNIVRISVESGEKTPFPLSLEADQNRNGQRPPSMSGEQQGLAVSPDGRVLAFIHTLDARNTGIYVVKLSGEMMPAGPGTFAPLRQEFVHGNRLGYGRAQPYSVLQPPRLVRTLESSRQPFPTVPHRRERRASVGPGRIEAGSALGVYTFQLLRLEYLAG